MSCLQVSRDFVTENNYFLFPDSCDAAFEIMQCVGEVSARLGIDPSKDLH